MSPIVALHDVRGSIGVHGRSLGVSGGPSGFLGPLGIPGSPRDLLGGPLGGPWASLGRTRGLLGSIFVSLAGPWAFLGLYRLP